MKAILASAALLLAAPSLAAAQEVETVRSTAAPEIAFDGADFLQLPKDMYLGEVAGVAVNPKDGHVFVFQRGNTNGPAYGAAAAQMLEFDKAGRFVREIGKGLYAWSYAHNVRLDPEGNIWAVDKGSDMVVKFNPAGRVTMVYGRKPEASDETAHPLEHPKPPLPAVDGQFRQVTDIAWDSQGNGYISDGYINSRVAKVSTDGRWLKSWGSYGTAPGQFDTLHSIAIDAKDRVFVADRGNRRIQVFDTEGKYLREFTIDVPVDTTKGKVVYGGETPNAKTGSQAPGAPDALCMTPGPNPVLFVGDLYPSRVYKVSLEGKVLGVYGQPGRNPGEFGWIHAIACPSEDEIYVGELINWRVQKLVTKKK